MKKVAGFALVAGVVALAGAGGQYSWGAEPAPPVAARPAAPVKPAPVAAKTPPTAAKPAPGLEKQAEPPDGDDDHDGVPNKADLCPDTLPQDKVNEWGCDLEGDG